MKAIVTDDCISCDLCVDTCPEVFEMASGEKATVKTDPVPPEFEDTARDACELCPVDAIILED
ncbi:MAG: ferredoxin [Armatimonadetes bacterium]|nr:ferredoxin [Armatimonadota bacterium]